MEIILWICIGLVFYTYFGYGVVLYLCVKIKETLYGKPLLPPLSEPYPEITLVIAAYNEEDLVESKMTNCYALKYPKGRLRILWVTDGSTDSTNQRLCNYEEVKVCFSPERKGKTAALNHAMELVETELVAFCDANTMLNTEAMIEIARCFQNPAVGCVAGEKRIAVQQKEAASSGGENLYWKYESALKELDSRLYSAVGAAGELFAIRSQLYENMPQDTLLDDFMLSMSINKKGYKTDYCKQAYACESGSADLQNEEKRKVRIAAGGLQSIWRLLPLLNIFCYGTLSFQYISHRVLRWTITPILFFALYPLNLALALCSGNSFYELLFGLQTLFYLMAWVGYILQQRKLKTKLFFAPLYLVFMNLNVIKAIPYLIKNKGKGAWEKAKRSS